MSVAKEPCRYCGRVLLIDVDTDGNGRLVEVVEHHACPALRVPIPPTRERIACRGTCGRSLGRWERNSFGFCEQCWKEANETVV